MILYNAGDPLKIWRWKYLNWDYRNTPPPKILQQHVQGNVCLVFQNLTPPNKSFTRDIILEKFFISKISDNRSPYF